MKPPFRISAPRKDTKNGGEYRVLYDSEGAWLGDIRAEHAEAIFTALERSKYVNDHEDAERYRWLRSSPVSVRKLAALSNEALDAAVDDARKCEPEQS